MKIIEPSAQIIEDELSQLSIYQRIAYCAGVCYQRDPRKTEEEAQSFCRRMVEIGHHSTLEMAVVHLVVRSTMFPDSKFITVTPKDDWGGYVVSGSIRALLEANGEYGSRIWNFLAWRLPVLFSESDHPCGNVRFAEPHEIPWQHKNVAVRFIVNRAVSHELVRHRPCSFLQESQRYCRYEDEVVFIRPEWADSDIAMRTWDTSMFSAEIAYKRLIGHGLKPQQARAVLPNSTKTELIAYASLPQWKHMFNLRCSPAADPEMVRVMLPLEQEFKDKYPEAFNEQDH